jgi:UDPglucose 6-dehydrogenase
MRIAIVGTGHVGLVTAACLAHVGHDVLGTDVDAEKIATIARGELPFHEPELADLLREGLETGRLRVSADTSEASRHGEVVFVCVRTPTKPSGEADLSQVEQVAAEVAANLDGYTVVAEKSTVPVGTHRWVRRTIAEAAPDAEFDVVANPEFLQEGRAVEDMLRPNRIVVGADTPRALEVMREVYAPVVERSGSAVVETDVATAELIKHASNAFLATKISFINSVAEVCERTGADVEAVARAMGLDPRIGPRFLAAGLGYGGACLPKDTVAFHHTALTAGVDFGILSEVHRTNRERLDRFVEKIREAVWNLEDKRIALWGLAYKPDTDDLREAPAVEVARRLAAEGARVVAYDPAAMPAAKSLLADAAFAADPYEAVAGAHCLAICTDWAEFAEADLERVRAAMARPVIVDGRNIFRPEDVAAAGFTYASMGRPTVAPG